MPAIPTPPDYSNNPVSQAYSRYQELEKKRAAVPLPDPQKLKPKWWERLAGAGVGFASGWGNAEQGARLGGDVTNRRYNSAMRDYTHQTGALDKQLEEERGGFPLAEAAGKIPQTAYENWMQRAKLGTEQMVGQGRIDQAEERNKLQADFNAGRLEDTQRRLDQLAAKAQSDAALRQEMLTNQSMYHQMEMSIQNARLDQLKERLSTVTSAKDLDNQEKQDTTALENEYKTGLTGTYKRLFGNKEKELADIHQRYQDRRAALGVGVQSSGSTTPAPQTHVWSKSGWAKANPGKDAATAERMATRQGFQVVP
jgi:hypothetical protein